MLKILRKIFPSIGRLTRYIEPSGKNIRVDSGVVEGSEITMFYDNDFKYVLLLMKEILQLKR